MAKKAKKEKQDPELVERLRRLGLRQESAESVADAVTSVKRQLPDSARSAIGELIAKVDELRGRVSEKSKPGDGEAGATGGEVKDHGQKKAGKKEAGKKEAAKKKAGKKKADKAKKAKKPKKAAQG